ncbi:PREDICTED: uncharacterized protein LOC108976430 [Bactrocera latifrons]|uniref:uncharacterized protein LOC108976430 n=1 Tax=Bactrocera latifrons TaxID=174628 RepID=UPI0008DE642A|nr:PREDICTED: uncharacterized protein LOC108976430 [Bactrocera latifrons]
MAFFGITMRAEKHAAWILSVVSKCLHFIGLFRQINKKVLGPHLGYRAAVEALRCRHWLGSSSQERRSEWSNFEMAVKPVRAEPIDPSFESLYDFHVKFGVEDVLILPVFISDLFPALQKRLVPPKAISR